MHPRGGEIRRLIVKRRLSARTVHERMSRLSNPAANFRVRGAFAASRLSLNKGQVSPRVHIMAKQLESTWLVSIPSLTSRQGITPLGR
jgi:hypothetical protein